MIVATLCYLKQNGQTLFLYRNKRKSDFHYGKYNGLGGKLKQGESPEDCVIREVFEESGFIIRDPILKGVITFPLFDTKNDWLVFIYTTDKFEGVKLESEEGELLWIADEQILELNLWQGDRVFLPWLKDSRFFTAKFIYENKEFIDYKVSFL